LSALLVRNMLLERRAIQLQHALARQNRPTLRRDPWNETIGPATRLDIEVPQPAITHTVTVQQLQRWASGSAVNPDERIRKDQLQRRWLPC
jgi:hypothetical protein